MTTTLPPRPPDASTGDAPTPPPPTPPRPPRRSTRARSHLVVAEVALAAMTAAAVFGFGRIFASWSFLAPLLVVALAGHATIAVCRRRGLGLPTTLVLASVEWLLVVTWLFFVDTTLALVPTPDTLSTARAELDRSWDAFHQIVAPAPVQTGFLLAAAAAVGGGAFLADWAAFRLWSAREAMVPSLTLFVFATLLADDRYRTTSAVLMVGTALAFGLAHRVVVLERSEGWVNRRASPLAGRRTLRAGALIAALAVLVGALAAPHLPGVDEPPLVDWRHDSASNARLLTSPLVSLRQRLVNNSDVELFTVQADRAAYWRIAALDEFDGTEWKLSADTDQIANGTLDTALVPDEQSFNQRFTMQNLVTDWLPAAFQPSGFWSESGDLVRYDAETSTLIGDEATRDGTSYVVQSVAPDFTAAELRRADPDVPRWVRGSLELPDDFSADAARTAEEATAGATTNFDKALALQQFFRETGGFTYSTNVLPGQSASAIDAFLRDRIGYCEQFSGAFAAMARSLGIPARVAVGYTWGEQDPSAPGTFQVLGRNAHAWPEVYLGQYGWVPFEPTPGRGNPDAESYAGVLGTQDDGTGAEEPTTTTTAPAETASPAPSTTAPGDEAAAASSSDASRSSSVTTTAARSGLLLAAAAALYLLAVPGGLALRRRRRRIRARGAPAAEVAVAWSETTESLAAVGVRPRPDETHGELAIRAADAVPGTGQAMVRLAATADAMAYGPTPSEHDASEAERAADEVRGAVDARLGLRGRLRRLLDPRPLWAGRTRRHRVD